MSDTLQTKVCKVCGIEKPVTDFYKHKSSKYGVTAICKTCRCLQDGFTPLDWREKLPDGVRRCTSCQQLYPETPEYFTRNHHCSKGLLNICKTCRNTKRKHEYANDPALRQQIAERVKSWQIRNPEKARRASRTSVLNYQSRKRNAPGKHTTKDIKLQKERQGNLCYWCKTDVTDIYHVDHYIPLNKGGSNWPSNIVIACPRCNDSKQDKLPYLEWTPPNPLFPKP